jgi:hypothetical protein
MIWRGSNETVPVKRSVAMVEDTKAMVWRLQCVMFEYELMKYHTMTATATTATTGHQI